MKNIILFTICYFVFFQINAQDSLSKKPKLLYTIAYNNTNSPSVVPLVGFVNQANHDHAGAEIGFVNTCLRQFSGAQVGFINSSDQSKGAQIGFINSTKKNTDGAQVGFVNSTNGLLSGAQIGFVNKTIKSSHGAQVGFINHASQNLKGAQIGFVNTARKKVTGTQLGFINYADEIENGVPIGFLSIVRKGGYKAIELSTNEIFPINLAFKTGVQRFYTYIKGAYNPIAGGRFGLGAGLGSNVWLGRSLFYNPEAETMSNISWNWDNQYVSFINSLRYRIGSNIELAAGPAITWRRNAYGEGNESNLSWAYQYSLNRRNDLIVGLRLSASATF